MRVSFPAAFLLPLVLAASAAGDVQPTVRQLTRMRLVGGFTLVYRVTVQDLRPPAFRAKEAADQEQGVEREIAAGRIAKSMAGYFKKQAEDLAQPRPTENFSLTLSAEGGRLLYMSTRSARDQKEGMKTAILLDGDKEYGLYGSSAEIENDGWRDAPVYRDENVDRLVFCPLPGVGLPGVDLIQSPIRAGVTSGGHIRFTGLVPRINLISGGASPYKPGELEAMPSQGRLLRAASRWCR